MKCFKCSAALEAGARFCGSCGSQQPGAVIPQAAVKTHNKTMFGGPGAMAPNPASTPAQPAQPAQAAPPKQDGRASLAHAATMAPTTLAPEVLAVQQKAAAARAAAAAVAPHPVGEIPADLTGMTLNNRYSVETKLGEGGFGAVYRAKQTGMNRMVALKVLHARMARDQQVVGRFKREAQASSLLRAPHTVQVYDFDQTPEGIMYLAMEMLEGKSIHQALKEETALSTERVARILDGLSDSLGEAHAQGIVHRDIKPENIFLEPRPTADFVKVLDFGIAKIVSGDGMASQGPALTAAGQTLGTLEYMSPEQLMGAQLDGRSDLYAMGILAYEMLTGALPFPSKTPGEMITAHLKTVPKPPSQAAPTRGIPPLMDSIVLKLVEKNRDKRYRDTAELRGDIAKVLAGETKALKAAKKDEPAQSSFVPEPTSRVAPLKSPGQTQMMAKTMSPGMIIAAVAVATAVLVAVIGVLWWLTHK